MLYLPKNEEGQGLVEYALILVLVVVVVVAIVVILGLAAGAAGGVEKREGRLGSPTGGLLEREDDTKVDTLVLASTDNCITLCQMNQRARRPASRRGASPRRALAM